MYTLLLITSTYLITNEMVEVTFFNFDIEHETSNDIGFAIQQGIDPGCTELWSSSNIKVLSWPEKISGSKFKQAQIVDILGGSGALQKLCHLYLMNYKIRNIYDSYFY